MGFNKPLEPPFFCIRYLYFIILDETVHNKKTTYAISHCDYRNTPPICSDRTV